MEESKELKYNIFYKEYYLNIVINKCVFFNWDSLNIYTNINEFFGYKLREEAIKYFEKYVIDKVNSKYVNNVLDKFTYHIDLSKVKVFINHE